MATQGHTGGMYILYRYITPLDGFYEHYTPCIQFCLLPYCRSQHYLKIKLDKIDIYDYNIFIYYSKDTHTRT
jgi:hypothetical protein